MVEAAGHVGRHQQRAPAGAKLEHGADETAGGGAPVAADTRSQRLRQQQAHASLVVRGARRIDEEVGREAGGEEGGVAGLLQGYDVQRQRRAPGEDVRQLAQEAEAEVESAQPQSAVVGRGGG